MSGTRSSTSSAAVDPGSSSRTCYDGYTTTEKRTMAKPTMDEMLTAMATLKVTNALSKMCQRWDPKLVMEAARSWLAYMDKVVAINTDEEHEP